ncbi:hypothetical protein D3C83_11540 [compost metagenome]
MLRGGHSRALDFDQALHVLDAFFELRDAFVGFFQRLVTRDDFFFKAPNAFLGARLLAVFRFRRRAWRFALRKPHDIPGFNRGLVIHPRRDATGGSGAPFRCRRHRRMSLLSQKTNLAMRSVLCGPGSPSTAKIPCARPAMTCSIPWVSRSKTWTQSANGACVSRAPLSMRPDGCPMARK